MDGRAARHIFRYLVALHLGWVSERGTFDSSFVAQRHRFMVRELRGPSVELPASLPGGGIDWGFYRGKDSDRLSHSDTFSRPRNYMACW